MDLKNISVEEFIDIISALNQTEQGKKLAVKIVSNIEGNNEGSEDNCKDKDANGDAWVTLTEAANTIKRSRQYVVDMVKRLGIATKQGEISYAGSNGGTICKTVTLVKIKDIVEEENRHRSKHESDADMTDGEWITIRDAAELAGRSTENIRCIIKECKLECKHTNLKMGGGKGGSWEREVTVVRKQDLLNAIKTRSIGRGRKPKGAEGAAKVTDKMSVVRAAKVAKVSDTSVRNWISSGKITGYTADYSYHGKPVILVDVQEVIEYAKGKKDRMIRVAKAGQEASRRSRAAKKQTPKVRAKTNKKELKKKKQAKREAAQVAQAWKDWERYAKTSMRAEKDYEKWYKDTNEKLRAMMLHPDDIYREATAKMHRVYGLDWQSERVEYKSRYGKGGARNVEIAFWVERSRKGYANLLDVIIEDTVNGYKIV